MFTASEHIVEHTNFYGFLIAVSIDLYWCFFISGGFNPLAFLLYLLPAGLLTVFVLWGLILSVGLLELCLGAIKKLMPSSPA